VRVSDRKVDDRTHPFQDASAPKSTRLGVVLRVLQPSGGGSVALAAGTPRVVGSGSDADVRIEDRTVSRRHAEFSLTPEGVLVRDLGSRNGSFYLDQRFEQMVLSLGAQVRLGAAVVALEVDPKSLADAGSFDAPEYRGILGRSSGMRRLFGLLERLEGSRASVLVEGESGVGKELVARAIHAGSDLKNGPWFALNCGALPRDLVASELFGHRRGAFTGATDARRGAFECADGGTLFLDEVGELPLELQPMLLRALEAEEIRPIGAEQPKRVKVRVIAATNRDLKRAVEEGSFREDLYYRLAVVRLRIPPLRERRDDITDLAQHFATGAGANELPSNVLEELKRRRWGGNVRELKNVVHAWAALGVLSPEESPERLSLDLSLQQLIRLEAPYSELKDELIERFTRLYLSELLAHTKNNLSAAARLAGLDRGHLRRLTERYIGRKTDD
jgi:DNA-binding NtrC family response regulator